jgi:hypothetical protein
LSRSENEAAYYQSIVNVDVYLDPECLSDPTSVQLSEEQVVEVCTPGGSGFRTGVCSSNWDDTDASVVCRQLSLGDNGGMLAILALLQIILFTM